jgi:LysM repeat protein
MRWCASYLSVCIFLTGCIASVQNSGSLSPRVTRLEGRVKSLEKCVSGSDSLVRDQQYLRRDLDETSSALARLEEDTSALRIELSRLRDRFDQIETGALAREKDLSDQVQSVAGVSGEFRSELDQVRIKSEEALQIASTADQRTKTAMDDLYDRMKRLDTEVQSLYNDIMRELTVAGGGPADGHHVVKAGETLGQIAKAYGVGLDAMKKANPQLTPPWVIHPGQKIKIP